MIHYFAIACGLSHFIRPEFLSQSSGLGKVLDKIWVLREFSTACRELTKIQYTNCLSDYCQFLLKFVSLELRLRWKSPSDPRQHLLFCDSFPVNTPNKIHIIPGLLCNVMCNIYCTKLGDLKRT